MESCGVVARFAEGAGALETCCVVAGLTWDEAIGTCCVVAGTCCVVAGSALDEACGEMGACCAVAVEVWCVVSGLTSDGISVISTGYSVNTAWSGHLEAFVGDVVGVVSVEAFVGDVVGVVRVAALPLIWSFGSTTPIVGFAGMVSLLDLCTTSEGAFLLLIALAMVLRA